MHLNNNIEILLSDPAAVYVWLTLSVDELKLLEGEVLQSSGRLWCCASLQGLPSNFAGNHIPYLHLVSKDQRPFCSLAIYLQCEMGLQFCCLEF